MLTRQRQLVAENGEFQLPRSGLRQYAEMLLDLGNRVQKNSIAFTLPRTVKTRGVVGVIECGPTRVEILPKINPKGSTLDDDRRLLVQLLGECGRLKRLSYPAASVGLQGSLAEWAYRSFADALLTAIETGLPRKYEQHSTLGYTIKGRIDFTELIGRTWRRDGQIPVRSFPLSFNNLFMRAVASVCGHLHSLAQSRETQDLLLHSTSILRSGGVASAPLEAFHPLLRRLELSIPGQIWEPVKEFVLTTIRQNAPHPLEGTGMRFFSILFSMQDLFERLVRRRVRQCLVGTALTLAPKERIPGTLEDQHGKQIGSLTPDLLLLNSAGDTAAVGDVKWKRLAENAAECTATITFRVWRQLSIYVSRISLF